MSIYPPKVLKSQSPLSPDERAFAKSLDEAYQAVWVEEIGRLVESVYQQMNTPVCRFPLDPACFPPPCTVISLMNCRLGRGFRQSLSVIEGVWRGLERLGIKVATIGESPEAKADLFVLKGGLDREQLSLNLERLTGKWLLVEDLSSLQRLPLSLQSQLGLYAVPCSTLDAMVDALLANLLRLGMTPSLQMLSFIQHWLESEAGDLGQLWPPLRHALLAHHWGHPLCRLRRGLGEDLDWVRQDASFLAWFERTGKKRSLLTQDAQLRTLLKAVWLELDRAIGQTRQLCRLLKVTVDQLGYDDSLLTIMAMTLQPGQLSESAWMEKLYHGLTNLKRCEVIERELGQPLTAFRSVLQVLEHGRLVEGHTVLHQACLVPLIHSPCLEDSRAGVLAALKESSKLNDLSVLYRLTLEAGKQLNIRDWFRSFASLLGKGEEEAEKDAALLARFTRAMYELQLMGVVQPSGRKRDLMERLVIDLAPVAAK